MAAQHAPLQTPHCSSRSVTSRSDQAGMSTIASKLSSLILGWQGGRLMASWSNNPASQAAFTFWL
eukprot:scaffold153713_cov17-Tisochrysis_lutea.AAC.1